MIPHDYQRKMFYDGLHILRKHNIVYFSAEERVGKTIPALLLADHFADKSILVLTKKRAIEGIQHTFKSLASIDKNKSWVITNYEQVKHVKGNPDVVILDEAHSKIAGIPKVSETWKAVSKFTKGSKIIYLSATPYAEGAHKLFHQFALSSFSPWNSYRNYYDWWREYRKLENGMIKYKHISAQHTVPDYSYVDTDKVLKDVQHLFISKRREDVGFTQEPEDMLHFITLKESTKKYYNQLLKHRICNDLEGLQVVCDTPGGYLHSLHQLENGVMKVGDKYNVLSNNEKIEYIKDIFGDTKGMVIMYHYVADGLKLHMHFKNATILQASAFAEGIDLYMYEHLIIYSQNFSASQYAQRRARQANLNRELPIKVNFLVVKNAVSHQTYKTVVYKKANFVDAHFERTQL